MTNVRQLVELYEQWAQHQVQLGAMAKGTHAYYLHHLSNWSAKFGDTDVSLIRPIDLMLWGKCWHAVQAVKRLFRWAEDAGLIVASPVARVRKPPAGRRTRVLDRREQLQALRRANRPFRYFLLALRESIARPQEVRELRWSELVQLPSGMLYACQAEFKGRRRRSNPNATRVIPISPRLQRLLERLRRRRSSPEGCIFVNTRGLPWTGNAVRIAMATLRIDAKLAGGEERVVCYTWRHTAATAATIRGLPDRVLADLMGHTTTRTTARYQHLKAEDLLRAFLQASK